MTEEALKQRRLARISHGGYAYLRTGIAPGCNVCIFGFAGECERYEKEAKRCDLVEGMVENLIREIMALDHIKDEDVILVEELARSKTFLWIIDKWLSRVGPFKTEALKKRILEGQPILKQRWVAANSMVRIADQLGLSPTARARLGLDKSGESGLAARAATIEAKSVQDPEIVGSGKASEELGDGRESSRREALGASGRRIFEMLSDEKLLEYKYDLVKFLREQFWVVKDGKPQLCEVHPAIERVLRLAFTPDGDRFRWDTYLLSAIKKSGKTTLAAGIVLWYTLFWAGEAGECYVCANDLEQSISRVFEVMKKAIRLNPLLRNEAKIYRREIVFPATEAKVVALPVDYSGAAGGNQAISSWDELWGYVSESARRLWEEFPPVPTLRNSIRVITTTAGFLGESDLLWELYQTGLGGERIDEELPIYSNRRLFMYWDHQPRVPWLTPEFLEERRNDPGTRPNTFLRLWCNQWVANESAAFDMAEWDACVSPQHRPLGPTKDVTVNVGVDAAVRGDHCAVVGTYREDSKVKLAFHKVWKTSKERPLDLEQTVEAYLLSCHEKYKLGTVNFDPRFMVRVAQGLEKKGLPMNEVSQSRKGQHPFTKALLDLVKFGDLVLYKDQEMRSAATKTVVDEDRNGLLKFAKDKAGGKIDLIVALGMSVMWSLEHEEPTGGFMFGFMFGSEDPKVRARQRMAEHLRQLYGGPVPRGLY